MTATQSDSGILAGEERMLIGGELVEAEGGRKFDVEHPATEEIVGQVADGTVADMEQWSPAEWCTTDLCERVPPT